MWADTQINALLFFTEQKSANSRLEGAKLQASLVDQALGLSRSLERCGKSLRLFTNRREELAALFDGRKQNGIEIVELAPSAEIPEGIRYYASHHKLFLFDIFASEGRPNCLIDLDVVADDKNLHLTGILGQMPEKDGWVYDISSQRFPAYGAEVVLNDLEMAAGSRMHYPRWFGGEFILGSPFFFAELSGAIAGLLPGYLANYQSFHHVGDEAIVSAALNALLPKLSIMDAGLAGLVTRHWSGPTRHVQPSAEILRRTFFWHLPDSKPRLATFARHGNMERLYGEIVLLGGLKRTVFAARNALQPGRNRP